MACPFFVVFFIQILLIQLIQAADHSHEWVCNEMTYTFWPLRFFLVLFCFVFLFVSLFFFNGFC